MNKRIRINGVLYEAVGSTSKPKLRKQYGRYDTFIDVPAGTLNLIVDPQAERDYDGNWISEVSVSLDEDIMWYCVVKDKLAARMIGEKIIDQSVKYYDRLTSAREVGKWLKGNFEMEESEF